MAIVFLFGFMPFAIAFVSNAGSSSEEAWINSMQHHDRPVGDSIADNSIWLENGGSNFSSWYETYQTPSDLGYLDCVYITNGKCEGYWDNNATLPNVGSLDLRMGLDATGGNFQGIYPFYSNDYSGIRTTEASQSHRSVHGGGSQYSGRSGNEIFSWYMSSIYLNEIDQGQTLDSLRFLMIDDTMSFVCEDPLSFASNITFEGEISFIHDNETIKYTNFDFEKYTKFRYSFLDAVDGTFSDSCAVGFFLEFDFTGFESLEIHTLTDAGDWDNTSMILTLKNFVNEDSPDDFGNTRLPFTGTQRFLLGVQHNEINPVETGFLIKTGTLILAVATLAVALVSTPYWDPFKNFFKGAV